LVLKGPGTAARRKRRRLFAAKVAKANTGGEIEIWGDASQTRSFLYIDECIEGTVRLLRSKTFGGTGQYRL